MPRQKSAYLTAEALREQACRAPTLETFAQSILEKAMHAAAEKIAAEKLTTDSVKLNCEIIVTFNRHAADNIGGCVQFWMPPDATHKHPYLAEFCWGTEGGH